jgi:hypothetical protein
MAGGTQEDGEAIASEGGSSARERRPARVCRLYAGARTNLLFLSGAIGSRRLSGAQSWDPTKRPGDSSNTAPWLRARVSALHVPRT